MSNIYPFIVDDSKLTDKNNIFFDTKHHDIFKDICENDNINIYKNIAGKNKIVDISKKCFTLKLWAAQNFIEEFRKLVKKNKNILERQKLIVELNKLQLYSPDIKYVTFRPSAQN